MRRKIKKPNDYPLFKFRLQNEAKKKELDDKLEAALKSANSKLEDSDRKYTKSEILTTALNKGLSLIEQHKLKLPD